MDNKSSSSSGSKAKKVRLTDFGRQSHVSNSALCSVLKLVKERGLPDALDRSSCRRQRQEDVNVQTRFGALIQPVTLKRKNGTEYTLWVQHPLAMIEVLFTKYPDIGNMLLGSDTLSIAIYSDEATPGSQIKGNSA